MRVLLDECLPRRLKAHLSSHEVSTVPEMGWAGTKDAALLRMAAAQFDVLVTIDQGLPESIGATPAHPTIVLLSARSNRLADLEPLMPRVSEMLRDASPGDVIRVPAIDA